ncbi:MAG TPA: DUF1491 family protein [Caulobacteraceae bacterium]
MQFDTDIWVYALIRRANQGGAFATVGRRGDARGGSVLVKQVNRRAGATHLYAEAVRGDGESVWMQPIASTDEADVDAYIARAVRIDPDAWVVEIDDPDGRHFLVERVEDR